MCDGWNQVELVVRLWEAKLAAEKSGMLFGSGRRQYTRAYEKHPNSISVESLLLFINYRHYKGLAGR